MADATNLSVGGRDPELSDVLTRGLDEFNFAATGTTKEDQGSAWCGLPRITAGPAGVRGFWL
jgi:hypothetical protein